MKLRKTASLTFQVIASLVIGGVLLWLALRNVDPQQVWQTLQVVDGRWIATGIAVYGIALFIRIIRWWVILHGVVSIRIQQVAAALLAGYAVNAILPARLGELFRANFCGRRYRISRATVLGTIMLERFADGVIVLSALVVGVVGISAEAQGKAIVYSALIAGLLIFGAFGLFLLLLGTPLGQRAFARHPWIAARFSAMNASVRQMRTWRMSGVIGLSIVVWIFDGAALWAVLKACQLELPFVGICLTIGVVSLSTLLPSPPGFVGTMQFAFALSVSFAGYPPSQGIAAATANQVFLIGSMVIVGLSILAWTSWHSIVIKRPVVISREDVADPRLRH